MRDSPLDVVDEHDHGPGYRNVAADVSIGAVALGLVLYVVRFETYVGIYWLFTVPACGLIGVVSGILGLVRARRGRGGTTKALVGLVVGLVIVVVSLGLLWFVWAWSHSNWQF